MNYAGRPAWRNQWALMTVTGLIGLLLFFVLLTILKTDEGKFIGLLMGAVLTLLVLTVLYRHYSWTFVVTQGAIESRHGIIGRNIRSIRVTDLRNVNLRQSVFQRLFRLGDLEFSTAGGAGIEVAFFGISRPMELKDQIQGLQGVGAGLDSS